MITVHFFHFRIIFRLKFVNWCLELTCSFVRRWSQLGRASLIRLRALRISLIQLDLPSRDGQGRIYGMLRVIFVFNQCFLFALSLKLFVYSGDLNRHVLLLVTLLNDLVCSLVQVVVIDWNADAQLLWLLFREIASLLWTAVASPTAPLPSHLTGGFTE